MKNSVGYISSIETTGMVDGPGIRFVVFFQGCYLRCKYCHNPETWKENIGEKYTSLQLIKMILRYKEYFISSNGGVTFSGGEPLIQNDFLLEILKLCKKNNLHTTLDTSGVSNISNTELFKILKLIDLVIFDLKHINAHEYKKLTSFEISKSLDFLNQCQQLNKKIWIRTVIVPDFNDNEKFVFELIKYVKTLSNIERVQLLAYKNPSLKYESLGLKYSYRKKDLEKEKLKKLQDLVDNEMLVKM